MRDIYRDPIFYYILAPLLIGLWPLLVWAIYLPQAYEGRESDERDLEEAKVAILGILEYDPDRLNIVGDEKGSRFTYREAIDSAANVCRIPSANYVDSIGSITSSGGKRIQGASVTLENVAIVQAARFLSTLQSTWVNLTCDNITLRKIEGMPDQWRVEMRFTYAY